MVRLFKFLLLVLAFASATLIAPNIYAQTSEPTLTPQPSPLNNTKGTPTPTRRSTEVSASVGALAATTSTITTTTSASTTLVQSPTLPLTSTAPTTSTNGVNNSGPLAGTILANRSETIARFFLEGETFQLEAARSQGLELPRATTVLNLFNCSGDLPDETDGCFWDPYLIQQDGFFEIYDSALQGAEPKLMLREAGAPPTGQVWVQNRTGQIESVVFKDNVYELQPTAVVEFPVATGVPAILYVRNCVTVDNQSACEWAPKSLDAGVYYAMVEQDTPGSQSGSTRTTIDLRPVVGEGNEATASTEIAPSAPSIVCSVVVPALNVRSGPGLQYDIIGKVRTTDGSAGTVNVTGRSTDNEWLTVDPSVAANGWINNSPSFITCSGDVIGLPIVEAPAPPTPQPNVVAAPTESDTTILVPESPTTDAPPASEATEDAAASPVATEEAQPTEGSAAIPAGQSVLNVNNGFQHEMRFTLDQMYRPLEGPSEFDLQPGESINIVVFPGDIPFTASSPWGGLSGNASVLVAPDESLPLWLRFEPEQGGSWVFRWN